MQRNRSAALRTTHVGEMFKTYFDQIPGVIERFAQDCWKQTKKMLNQEQRAYPPYFKYGRGQGTRMDESPGSRSCMG